VTYSDFKKSPDLDRLILKICSMILALVSFIFSYSIYNRLNTLEK
jgi:hypothetical protein